MSCCLESYKVLLYTGIVEGGWTDESHKTGAGESKKGDTAIMYKENEK